MSATHALVWLDHRDARIVEFSRDHSETLQVHSGSAGRSARHRGGSGGAKATDDHHFFDEIVTHLVGIPEVLVAGPGSAKTEFHKYVEQRHRDLGRRIVGVEALDHPTDGELLAHARTYFKGVDQLGRD